LRYRSGLPANTADVRPLAVHAYQAYRPSPLPPRTRYEIGPSLARKGNTAHVIPDVAVAAGLLLRRRPSATCTTIWLCLRRAVVSFPSLSWRKPQSRD